VVLALFTLSIPGPSDAGVIPLAQERLVTALATASDSEGFETDSDLIRSDESGQFGEQLSFDAFVGGARAEGQSFQSSSIQGASLSAVASFFGQVEIADDDEFAEGFGRSILTYDFRLTDETAFTVAVEVQASGNGVTVFQLNGPSGNIYSVLPPDENPFSFSDSGSLPPGDYDVFISTSGFGQATSAQTSNASGSYYVTLDLDATVAVPVAGGAAPLLHVAPNPIRHVATVELPLLGFDRELGVTIHSADGRLVARLAGSPGTQVQWDGRGPGGLPVASGVYFVRLDGAPSGGTRVTVLR
jgi:hypothetical protein